MMILRWPGSKWQAADYLISQMGHFDEYREGFLGSGGVFWRLPKRKFKRIWLNDLNLDLINLFRAVKGETDPDFVSRAVHYATTFTTATQIRDIWEILKERFVLFGDSAAYWFLHRFAYGAIVSRARPDIAALPKKDRDLERYLPKTQKLTAGHWQDRRDQLANVELTTLDYSAVLTERSRNRCAVLLDPPYTIRDNNSKFYERAFTSQQHEELRDKVRACSHRVVITTGDDVTSDLLFRHAEGFSFHEHYYTRSVVGTVNPGGAPTRRKQFVVVWPGIATASFQLLYTKEQIDDLISSYSDIWPDDQLRPDKRRNYYTHDYEIFRGEHMIDAAGPFEDAIKVCEREGGNQINFVGRKHRHVKGYYEYGEWLPDEWETEITTEVCVYYRDSQ